MTPEDRNLLTRFLNDLTQFQGVNKDPEAHEMISQALSRNPDAPYVLVQHAVVSDQALHAAQARIADLEAQLAAAQPQYQQPQPGFLGGGLGSLFGGQPRQGYGQAPFGQPQYGQPQQAGFGSFLRNVGTTAAGVAAGEALFGGLESIFGGRHGMFGGGGETIINEYNDFDDGNGGFGF